MGAIFAERVLGVANPRVALLSIGEEKGKGDARIQRATELLDATDLHFVGNVEGKDLTKHLADVVVCDAVLGNVVIKFFEGLSTFIFDLWRARVPRARSAGRLAYLLMRPGIGRIRDVFDYERVGGSPLLGVRGTVIITHGRARRRMIALRLRRRGDDGPDPRPGAHRRGARRPPAPRPLRTADAETADDAVRWSRGVVSGPELTVGAGRHRRAGPARRVRGPGRRSASAAAARPGVARSAVRAVASRIRDDRVLVRLWIVARPGPAARPADRARSGRPSAATVERLLGLELGRVTVLVDGVGG